MIDEPLFQGKPWEYVGRKMERNAPRGTRCTPGCTHPRPRMNTKTALCSVCHESFGVVRNFDKHRDNGWCLDPATIGLRKDVNGHWRELGDPDYFAALNDTSDPAGGVPDGS